MIFYLLVITLILMFFQDLLKRSIHLIFFFALPFFICYYKQSFIEPFEIIKNLIFVIALLFSLFVYVRIRRGKWMDITKEHFAWGDILFLLLITPLFPNYTFMMFFVFVNVLVLITGSFIALYQKNKTIPFAGLFALFTAVILTLEKYNLLNI